MSFPYPPLRDVQINLIKYSHRAPGYRWEHGVIIRNRYALIWAVDGPESLVTEVDGRVLPLPTGSLLLLRPGLDWVLENRHDAVRPAALAEVWFDFRKLPHGWPPPATWPLLVTPPVDSAIFPLIRYALTIANCDEPERTALGQAVFPLLLLMVLTGRHAQHQPQTAGLPESLERVWQIVRQSGGTPGKRPRRLPELAREAGISAGHLTHLFTRHLGISPREFMLSHRLEHAATLLAGSALRIKEIARLTGFCDQFHFSRQFAKLFGCAPKHYRDMPAGRRPIVNVLERLKTPIPEPLQIPSYAATDLLQRAGGLGATTTRLLRELRHDLAANRSPFAFPADPRRRWRPLPLAPFANRSRQAEPDGMFGPGTRDPHLPPGTLRAHGIPFVLPEESTLGGRSVILLRSTRLPESHLPESVVIPLNGRAAGLGLLHLCAWTQGRHMQLGEYEILYADHRRVTLPVMTWGGPASGTLRPGLNTAHPVLQDYWPDAHQIETHSSRTVTVVDPDHPLTSIRYLYTFWWENPHPEAPLRRLILRGRADSPGLLAVLGVTLLGVPAKPRVAAPRPE